MSEHPLCTLLAEDSRLTTEGFQQLYALVQPKVFAFVQYRTTTREQALDLTQDILLELYQALTSFVYRSDAEFYGFLFTITRRALARHYAHKHTKAALQQSDIEIDEIVSAIDVSELELSIRQALEQLAEEERDIIVLWRNLRTCWQLLHKLYMSTKPTIDQILDTTAPCTTAAEFARMLAFIESSITPVTSTPSPYAVHYYFTFKPISYFALALVLLLGATSTVAASGSARPGDILFPIDRATESVRLALASDSKKEQLRHSFMVERFSELHEIVAEENVGTSTATSSTSVTVRAEGESRIAHAIAILATHVLNETDATKRDEFARDLMAEVSALRVEGRTNAPLRLDDSRVMIDESRTGTRTKNERVKIEQKDGQVTIRYEDRQSDDSDAYDDSDDRTTSLRDIMPATSTERVEPEHPGDDSSDDYDSRESLRQLDTVNTTISAEDHDSRDREDDSYGNGSEDDQDRDSDDDRDDDNDDHRGRR